MRSNLIKKITTFLLVIVILFCPVLTVSAAETPIGPNSCWVRAKLTYEFDEGITGLSDDIVDFADGWVKKGDWYYYQKSIKSGDKVRFITCVNVPAEWTEKLENKKFAVIATAEVSEVAPGDTGWDTNASISYSKSFDVWSMGYSHNEDVWVEEGDLSIHIHESQLDENGNEVPYENNKLIVPGQRVSKIIDMYIGGATGENRKLNPEKPVKTVMCNGIDAGNESVDMGAVLTYSITVKNPAPDTRKITITDNIDNRLIVIDTGGAVFTKKPDDNGTGGILEWEVTAGAWESRTVTFTAQVADGVHDEVIPNIADVTIVGRCVKSNAVYTNVGSPSIIKQVIARATYDTAHFAVAVFVSVVIIVCIIAVIALMKRRNKENKGGVE